MENHLLEILSEYYKSKSYHVNHSSQVIQQKKDKINKLNTR